MRCDTCLREASLALEQTSETPRLDAEILLAFVLSLSRSQLYARLQDEVADADVATFNTLVDRRKREPIAYITGKKSFWSLELNVNADVLVPRPETECLVVYCLEQVEKDDVVVIDCATGSGAIACALATERPQWTVLASDYSLPALSVANQNRTQYQLNSVHPIAMDWLTALADNTVDVVISNPPYIAPDDPHLLSHDLHAEPRQALVAENNGLQAIESLVPEAARVLRQDGLLIVEHGFRQGEAVREIFKLYFRHVETLNDLSEQPRFTVGKEYK